MGLPIINDIVINLSHILDVDFSKISFLIFKGQVNFLVCMLISYPLALLNRFLIDSKARLIFGLLTGMLLQFQMFGLSMIHIIIATINTHLFIKYLGRKFSPFYVLIFNILHLSYLHIRVLLESYGDWSLGIEASYMMSICKFSSIAFNYEDGGKNESELKSSHSKANRIQEKPALLETFSYVFYFPSCLVGPSFEFSYFKRYIYLEGEYKNINYKKCNISALESLFCSVILVTLLVKFAKISDPNYCTTEEYANRTFMFKYLYVYFSMIITRCKYYIGWKLGGGSIDLCGLGYDVKINEDGKEIATFDRIDPCNLRVMEWSINPRIRLQYWNRSVHLWLKYYIYLRLINTKLFSKKKVYASLITFTISAMWHGFYPSYYLFFFQCFFIEQISTFLEDQYDFFNKVERSGFVLRFIFLQLIASIFQYFGQSFAILSIKGVYKYYSAFSFIPNILLILIYIFVSFQNKRKKEIRKVE